MNSLIYRYPLLLFGSVFLFASDISFAVDISPSKYQGGTTNYIPNKVEDSPTLFKSPLKWIFSSIHSEAMNRVNAPPNFKVELSTEPKVFTPSSNAPLKARMLAVNQGKDKYILEFTSAQHYDFIIHRKSGEEVYRWSNDKTFSQQLSSIVINRNEKLVYEEELFSSNGQALSLPSGEYKLMGKITSKVPISVEASFQVLPSLK